ncbi:type II toxin-antitoxin system VapC family toxin [Glycocaulis sp.]|uniref:type II toxin-antitoxin system VapC family toxin n=1 Tax=Glycocaulis sp. TaxID=1969725 RepID=UPI003D1F00B3
MRLLCDTHSYVWYVTEDSSLSSAARAAIDSGDPVVSLATVWEIAIKVGAKNPPVMANVLKRIRSDGLADGFEQIGIDMEDVIVAGLMPLHHRDPFDRLLAAQARNGDMPIVSSDRAFDAYGVERIW